MAPPSGPAVADERVTHTSGDLSTLPDLRFIHYNDVYHIDASSREPVGGIARFKTLCNYYRNDSTFQDQSKLIILFSGDAFNPSLESSVTKGVHMVSILNNLNTDVACVGNHDLDFGVPQFRQLASKCNFPWLLANVLDPALGEDVPLGNAKKTVMLTSSNGIKIGVIGIVEKEWLDTLNSVPPDLIYKPASATVQELVPGLREQGAEIIVVVSHQREPNDNRLAANLPEGLVDIVLGGHDHYYKHSIINGIHVLRSGSDFKQLSYIEARRQPSGGKWDFHIVRRDVVSKIKEDQDILKLTEKLTSSLKAKLEKPLGYTAAPLDARFTTVRVRESNIGNFICDIMRSFYQGDCCIMASGTIRGDQIYPPGLLRLKDIMNCFPFEDPCVVIQITGKAILEALENAVSLYPALEGRFPQVSNIEFEFDPNLPSHSRITSVKIGGQDLDLKKEYTVVTRDYMARGKDGYTSLLTESEGGVAKELVSEENGILISMLLRQYFMSLKILGKWKHWCPHMHSHWDGVHQEVHDKHPVIEPTTTGQQKPQNLPTAPKTVTADSTSADTPSDDILHDDSDSDVPEHEDMPGQYHSHHHHHHHRRPLDERQKHLMKTVLRKWWRLTGLPGHPSLCRTLGEEEFQADWTRAIAPRIEGRIKIVGQSA